MYRGSNRQKLRNPPVSPSHIREDPAVDDGEPPIVAYAPLPSSPNHRLEVSCHSQTQLANSGTKQAEITFCPRHRPPRVIAFGNETPARSWGHHMSQSRPVRPRREPAPGAGLASIDPCDRHVHGELRVHVFRLQEPTHGGVYDVVYHNRPAGVDGPAHFPERRHGIVHMLKHLVGVNHVECATFEEQRERVADGRLNSAQQASGHQGRPGGFSCQE